MNQTEQMREALRMYMSAGSGNSTDFDTQAQAFSMAKQALAAEPVKLVRLTESEYIPLWFDFGRLRIEESVRRYSERFMDALEAKNGGA